MIRILLLTLAVSSARSEMSPYIVRGEEVSVRHWPFIAFVEAAVDGQMVSACGGSLISSQTVLTAAHCVDDPTRSKKLMSRFRFTIYMGHSEFSHSIMGRTVIDYMSHKNYDPKDSTVVADIAVLFLNSPVKFASTVKKVLLLKRRFDVHRDKLLQVAGWGMTNPRNELTPLSAKLKAANLKALSYENCKKVAESPAQLIICTSPSKEYAYSGDSGGPLIKKDSQYQIGLVSYRDETSGVTMFTSVPSYYNWIKSTQYALFKKYCPKKWKKSVKHSLKN